MSEDFEREYQRAAAQKTQSDDQFVSELAHKLVETRGMAMQFSMMMYDLVTDPEKLRALPREFLEIVVSLASVAAKRVCDEVDALREVGKL